MKTIEEIADEYFSESGLKSKDYAMIYTDTRSVYDIMVLVGEQYAKQRCDEQIKACAENAKTKIKRIDNPDIDRTGTMFIDEVRIDTDSILSTPNVAENK